MSTPQTPAKHIQVLYYVALSLLLVLAALSAWNFYLIPNLTSDIQMQFWGFLFVKCAVVWGALYWLRAGAFHSKPWMHLKFNLRNDTPLQH